MEELKPFDKSEENKLTQEPLINNENSFFKKNKTLIIIIASILVLAIIITVLCVCLLKGSNGDEGDKGDEEDKNYDVIKLEVYSDSDDKEILFLSDEFNLRQDNLKGNEIMYVDGKSYTFAKSMKLNKGNHIVKLKQKIHVKICSKIVKILKVYILIIHIIAKIIWKICSMDVHHLYLLILIKYKHLMLPQ